MCEEPRVQNRMPSASLAAADVASASSMSASRHNSDASDLLNTMFGAPCVRGSRSASRPYASKSSPRTMPGPVVIHHFTEGLAPPKTSNEFGLIWKNVGPHRPKGGIEWSPKEDPELVAALEQGLRVATLPPHCSAKGEVPDEVHLETYEWANRKLKHLDSNTCIKIDLARGMMHKLLDTISQWAEGNGMLGIKDSLSTARRCYFQPATGFHLVEQRIEHLKAGANLPEEACEVLSLLVETTAMACKAEQEVQEYKTAAKDPTKNAMQYLAPVEELAGGSGGINTKDVKTARKHGFSMVSLQFSSLVRLRLTLCGRA